MTSKSEKSYIQTSLLSEPPLRADGRSLVDYRNIQLATGVVPSANGSARVNLGGTHILAACKLEIDDVQSMEGVDGGRIVCTVSCSPSGYPHYSSATLDDIQHDLSGFLNSTLAHPSLCPKNLAISANKKAWLLNLDCVVLTDVGNIYDALFIAARAALWNTRVPIIRPVEYKDTHKTMDLGIVKSGLDTGRVHQAVDFVLEDSWSEGEVLDGRDRWPVCITLNLISSRHFLDATLQEEAAVPLRILLVFSYPDSQTPVLQGVRLIGSGEMASTQPNFLVKDGLKYARALVKALNTKLQSDQTL